jgi:hypothetical protein
VRYGRSRVKWEEVMVMRSWAWIIMFDLMVLAIIAWVMLYKIGPWITINLETSGIK